MGTLYTFITNYFINSYELYFGGGARLFLSFETAF